MDYNLKERKKVMHVREWDDVNIRKSLRKSHPSCAIFFHARRRMNFTVFHLFIYSRNPVFIHLFSFTLAGTYAMHAFLGNPDRQLGRSQPSCTTVKSLIFCTNNSLRRIYPGFGGMSLQRLPCQARRGL